jgi:hypothetical protein
LSVQQIEISRNHTDHLLFEQHQAGIGTNDNLSQ